MRDFHHLLHFGQLKSAFLDYDALLLFLFPSLLNLLLQLFDLLPETWYIIVQGFYFLLINLFFLLFHWGFFFQLSYFLLQLQFICMSSVSFECYLFLHFLYFLTEMAGLAVRFWKFATCWSWLCWTWHWQLLYLGQQVNNDLFFLAA